MDKTTWTEADFENLGWHDNHVHGLSIQDGEYAGKLVLDLDYICEWLCGTDRRCSFMLAPADLVFRDVTELRINIEYKSIAVAPISIGEIRREIIVRTERYTECRWQILFNFPQGEISFQSPGFAQVLRALPIHKKQQFLTEDERIQLCAAEQGVGPDGSPAAPARRSKP
jgi:hypothetical protein